MTEEQKQRLESQLWKIANELRGKMDADEFRDYILGFIFYKYLSEKQHLFANKLLETEEIRDYLLVTNGEDLEAIKDESLEKLGYFLQPNELFSAITKKGNIKIDENDEEEVGNFILEDLQGILNAIEQSTMGNESEDDFNKLFEDIDLASTKLGRTPNARNQLIAKVLAHLNAIDFQLDQVDADVLGDAYEYLIAQFASGAGKKAGEFYTPQQVSRVLAKIVPLGKNRIKNAYDPACGSGSLLLRIAKEAEVGDFAGQELNRTTYNLARMNMILHDVHFSRFDIRQEDTLEEPQHLDERFEVVVANPPFSAKWKSSDSPLHETDDRFSQYGRLAPGSKADFAFLQHMIYQLADNGTAAVVLPHGVLYRSGAEAEIRKYIINDLNYLDAVIGLPPNLFYGTSIPACILVLKKCRPDDGDILFVDASLDFDKRGNQNFLLDRHVNDIVDAYQKRETITAFSTVVSLEEISDKGFNLNISSYVDTIPPDEPINISSVVAQMAHAHSEMKEAEDAIQQGCKSLEIEIPVGYNVDFLKKFKQGCMQRLFSGSLRFKNNNGQDFPAWRDKKLEDLVVFLKGKGVSKADIDPQGSTPCIRYGEIYTLYSERITQVASRTGVSIRNLVLSEPGDVIIPASGEDRLDMARACCVEMGGIALGGDINILRGAEDGVFLAYYLNGAKKREIANSAQGFSVVHIYPSQLKSIHLPIPHINEQRKVSEFLGALDTKIKLVSK